MTETNLHILGVSGSLRQSSYNTGLLRAAQELLPEGMTLEIYGIRDIPLYDNDLYLEGIPESVQRFKARIRAADALMIATPEYNYSIPGVLKNALDWASRPPKESPFSGKPLAIMGAGGVMGTIRAQNHLRQIAAGLNLLTLNKPEVAVARAWEKFDQNGTLVDEVTKGQIKELLQAFQDWILRLRQ